MRDAVIIQVSKSIPLKIVPACFKGHTLIWWAGNKGTDKTMKQGFAFQARSTLEKVILTKNDHRKEQVSILPLYVIYNICFTAGFCEHVTPQHSQEKKAWNYYSLKKTIYCCCCCSDTKSCPTLCNPIDCKLLCPSLSPAVCSDSCPLSWWCHPTLSSSVVPFSSCFQSFPASGSFSMSQLFISGGQKIGASASALSFQWIFRVDFL